MHKRIDEFIKNPKKALFTISFPILIGTLVQTLYNLVDTAWVGRLGADAIAALTFSFPIFFILMGINQGINIGMSSRISRYLGEKHIGGAENAAMHGIILSVIASVIVTAIGLLTLNPLLSIIGASGEVLRLSHSYTSIILWGVIIMFPSFVLNGILTSQGETRTTMEVQITGLVLNIILDPIFIYVFKIGVAGAAVATLISMFVSLMMLIFLMKKRSHIRVHHKTFHFSWFIIKDMMKIGIPASILMILISFYFMILNRIVVHFGTDYIAAFGLVFRLESIVIMPVLAFSTGLMTLMGMFYGAKRYDLMRSIYWYTIKILLIITVTAGIIMFAVPNLFLLIFTSDPALICIGVTLMHLLVFTYPLTAIAMTTSRGMQAMGLGMPGLVVNLLRTIVISFPLAYILVYHLGFGIEAVAISMIAGGVVSTIASIAWIEHKFHKLNHHQASEPKA